MSASHLDLRCRLGKGNLIHMLMPVGSVKSSTGVKKPQLSSLLSAWSWDFMISEV